MHRLRIMTLDEWQPLHGLDPLPGNPAPFVLDGGWWLAHTDGQAYAADVLVGQNDDGLPCVFIWADLSDVDEAGCQEFKQFVKSSPTVIEPGTMGVREFSKEAQILALILGRLSVCDASALLALGFEELA